MFIECSDSSNQDLVIIQTTVHASIHSVYSGQQMDIEYVTFVPWVSSTKTEFPMAPKIKITPNREG